MRTVEVEVMRNRQVIHQEKRRAPGLRRIFMGAAAMLLCMSIFLGGCGKAPAGTPHLVTIDGFSVEPGKTTVQELSDAGFYISDTSMRKVAVSGGQVVSGYEEAYELSSEVEPKTYYYMLKLVKDGQSYAGLTVVNESSSKATLADCKVRSISVYSSEEKADEAKLNGIAMKDLTVDALKESSGEPESEEEEESSEGKSTVTSWAAGNYSMELTVKEDGTVSSFKSEYEKK